MTQAELQLGMAAESGKGVREAGSTWWGLAQEQSVKSDGEHSSAWLCWSTQDCSGQDRNYQWQEMSKWVSKEPARVCPGDSSNENTEMHSRQKGNRKTYLAWNWD